VALALNDNHLLHEKLRSRRIFSEAKRSNRCAAAIGAPEHSLFSFLGARSFGSF
jgi:hypothetical protein